MEFKIKDHTNSFSLWYICYQLCLISNYYQCRLFSSEYLVIIGLDLVDEYCNVAKMLAKKVGLEYLVDYRQGDATNMPFDNNSFDIIWTQHASTNIADKQKLYSEM